MTSPSRRKGDAAEREVVAQLRDLGVPAERAYGAGRPDDTGDLDGLSPFVCQVKSYADPLRAQREALVGAVIQQAGRPATFPWALVRHRGGVWVASCHLETFASLWREVTA